MHGLICLCHGMQRAVSSSVVYLKRFCICSGEEQRCIIHFATTLLFFDSTTCILLFAFRACLSTALLYFLRSMLTISIMPAKHLWRKYGTYFVSRLLCIQLLPAYSPTSCLFTYFLCIHLVRRACCNIYTWWCL